MTLTGKRVTKIRKEKGEGGGKKRRCHANDTSKKIGFFFLVLRWRFVDRVINHKHKGEKKQKMENFVDFFSRKNNELKNYLIRYVSITLICLHC